MKLSNRYLKIALLTGLIALTWTAMVSANSSQVTSSFSMNFTNSDNSAIFMKDVKAGDSVTAKIRVQNTSNQKKEFTIFPSDTLPTLRGGWTYQTSKDTPKLMGSWLDYKPEKYTLAAGAKKDFSFVVKVPKDLPDGQYIASVVLEEFIATEVSSSADKMSAMTDVYSVLPLQIVMNINPDKAKHLVKIGELYHETGDDGLITVYVPHINEGTILEKPSGKLVLSNSSGKVILRESYTMDSVYVSTTGLYDLHITQMLLPDTYKLSYEVEASSGLLKGDYTFTVNASDLMASMDKADNVGNEYSLGIWSFLKEYWMWLVAVILIIVILMIIIIILLFKRGRKKDEERAPKAKVRQDPFNYS